MHTEICPVCGRPEAKTTIVPSEMPRQSGVIENRTHSQDAHFVQCPTCGRFAITPVDRDRLHARFKGLWSNGFRLSSLIHEQTIRAGSARPLLPFWLQLSAEQYGPIARKDLTSITLEELLARWPATVPERLDRSLCNLAWLSSRAGTTIAFKHNDSPRVFAEAWEEAQFHLQALASRKLLRPVHTTGGEILDIVVTAEGWERFTELVRGASTPENPVFVAMWFGVKGGENEVKAATTEEQMTRVYLRGIEPAIKRAGYKATRVDFEQFNDAIMDQVLGDIRAAPFVVADTTGHRNGVYFEAGFARGLGRPVIHTCAEWDFPGTHFDVKHLNHIRCKNASNPLEQPFLQISATLRRHFLGPAPLRSRL